MIEIKNLSFSYRPEGPPVLADISIRIRPGFNFLLGENGAGKTTLMKCVTGLMKPIQGQIIVAGRDISTLKPKEMAGLVSYIPQAHVPAFNHLVTDVVLMGTTRTLRFYQTPDGRQTDRVLDILSRLGIADLAARGYGEISGGQRQLVLIARALIQDSRILIMDEPAGGLDFGNQVLLMRTLQDLAEAGYTILLSSHNPQTAAWFATHVMILNEGKVVAYGTPEEVMTERHLTAIYRHPVHIIKNNIEGAVRYCFYPASGKE
ncbi:MAG: ABC transporter ATP-binding protein [Eubacteriales bacterium]|nr:ABC transporter ATP-binding protein [Eubacteriales bacterium]